MIAEATHKHDLFRLWVKFRMFYPLKREPYNPTHGNIIRWNMHVSNQEKLKSLPVITVDDSEIRKIREKFSVKTFEQFPQRTRWTYEAIARCFPGYQVYACGSRVRGDYVDKECPEDKIVLNARKKAGMRFRGQSDFDFWVEPGAVQTKELPRMADRARLRVPNNEKVPIPICQ